VGQPQKKRNTCQAINRAILRKGGETKTFIFKVQDPREDLRQSLMGGSLGGGGFTEKIGSLKLSVPITKDGTPGVSVTASLRKARKTNKRVR